MFKIYPLMAFLVCLIFLGKIQNKIHAAANKINNFFKQGLLSVGSYNVPHNA